MFPMNTGAPPPPPREGQLPPHSFSHAFAMLFGGIWGAVGALLVVIFSTTGAPPWDDWILDRRAVTTTATPVHSEPTNTRINRVRVYEVTYRYQDNAGTSREGSVRVTGGRETPFELEYDPESPARARIKGESASVFGLGILIPLFFALVGGGVFFWGLAGRLRERALYRDGSAAQAQVTQVERTGARYNRRPVFRVHFIYQTPSGSHKAARTTVTPPVTGATIWVFYDPASPENVMMA
jgi:hypothetical protein